MIDLETKSGSPQKPHVFETRAMATMYQIFIRHEDKGYASQAAQDAFDLLYDLEQELSYYISNSDVTIFNQTEKGKTIRIGEHAWNCARICEDLYKLTKGLYDPTVGHFKHGAKPLKKFRGLGWATDPEKNGLILKQEDVQMDLGGMGKGYALDQLALILDDWDIHDFLIHGGRSSVLTSGSMDEGGEGWPVSLSLVGDGKIDTLNLKDESMSSSGILKGDHIIDPATGESIKESRATWIIGPNAAVTDGLSTALMMMPTSDIKKLIKKRESYKVIVRLDKKKKVEYYGF
ncbi:MAG: FAD:protein FMN transferase [Bacteroidota bacterium]